MKLPRIVSSLPGGDAPVSASIHSFPSVGSDSRIPLVLHLDINETILVGDEAGGDSRDDTLHKILAKSAFVRLPDNLPPDFSLEDTSHVVPTHWWDGTPLAASATAASSSSCIPPPLYTGWHWPPHCCPYYRTAHKARAKRFALDHGAIYRPLYDKMHDLLSLRSSGKDDSNLPPLLSHFLPALFETLQTLAAQNENDNDNVRIVLRTFGSDLRPAADVISAFCSGRHPDCPDFSYPPWAVVPPDCLVRGRWEEEEEQQQQRGEQKVEDNHDSCSSSYVYSLFSQDGTTRLATGDAQVLEWLADDDKPICGIQDDYHFWSRQGCAPWAGKPVWAAPKTRDHHLLLDDNIHNLATDSIASVRYPDDDNDQKFRSCLGEEIQQLQGVHLIRVPTVEPILNPKWFLEQIEQARLRYQATLAGDSQKKEQEQEPRN